MKKIKKFYVGAEHIAQSIADGHNSEWQDETLEQAIKKGKDLLDQDDRDCVIIVRIVRIIRREKSPVVVEKV